MPPCPAADSPPAPANPLEQRLDELDQADVALDEIRQQLATATDQPSREPLRRRERELVERQKILLREIAQMVGEPDPTLPPPAPPAAAAADALPPTLPRQLERRRQRDDALLDSDVSRARATNR